MERRDYTITKVARHAEGHWTAHVSIDGYTFDVDRMNGSWRLWDNKQKVYREVLPHVAEALQKRVKAAARKELAAC